MKNPTEELTDIYFSLWWWDISLALNMTVFFIPYRRLCRHFACAADAPLLSLSRHFPRFSGGIYPEGGSAVCFTVIARERSDRGNPTEKVRNIYFVDLHPPGRLRRSLRFLAKTVEFPCHRERKRGDPFERVRGIYSVLRSNGLPRSLRSLAMTVKQTALPPSG